MNPAVLYIEDNDDNIRLVERIFRTRPQVELRVAGTGGAGLNEAQQAPPALILLDRRLPDMLGNEVVRQLKAEPGTADIPIVMLSGDSPGEHAQVARQLGVDDFLAKPFDITHLLSVVDRYCG